MLHLNIHYFASRVRQHTSHILCPSIHAVRAATKSSAAHASNTKEAMPKGIPPKTGVAQEGAKRERHLQILEGKGVGRYCT